MEKNLDRSLKNSGKNSGKKILINSFVDSKFVGELKPEHGPKINYIHQSKQTYDCSSPSTGFNAGNNLNKDYLNI